MRPSLLLFLVALGGCAPAASRFYIQEYSLNQPTTVTVGSTMMRWGYGDQTDFGLSKSGLSMELLYGGIDHDVILVTYREYTIQGASEFARGDFSQALRYDLAKSHLITFKYAQLSIENADQAGVTFIVVKGPIPNPFSPTNTPQGKPVGMSTHGFFIDEKGAVTEVKHNSPADSVGLRVGDEVFEINNDPLPKSGIKAILEKLDDPNREWTRLRVRRGDYQQQFDLRRPQQ